MKLRALVAALAVIVTFVAPATRVSAQVERIMPVKDPADAPMKALLDALKSDAYVLWTETAPKLSGGKLAFEALRARVGARLLKGYKTTPLGTLRKPDGEVHLWKLEPAAAREDFEIRLVMKDAQVTSFAIE
ncbi:MAG TPA: hypothetical protein VH560_10105 [Polyangia bacterium]|jgi:hypothetical protein|nr:hypothetical protein [Polyangia bacterium]